MSLPTPYYDQDGIQIFCGDCREILPHLPNVDCFVTDPPYGVNLGRHRESAEHAGLRKAAYASYDDSPENFDALVPVLVTQLVDSIGRGAVFCPYTHIGKMPQWSAKGGVYLPAGAGLTSWGFNCFSDILFYGTPPNRGRGCRPTVLVNRWTCDDVEHPCPKPLEWLLWLVGLASDVGERVVDPFMGSGTTLWAAKQLGRKAIGIEIEEKYCEIAVKRLAQQVFDFSEPAPKPKDGVLL